MEFDTSNCDDVMNFARQLELELTATNERINRLIEAGDALSDPFTVGEDDIEAWTEAKESK